MLPRPEIRPAVASAAAAVALAAVACSSAPATSSRPRQEIEVRSATLDDFKQSLPNKPALAAYQYRLQKRIDDAYAAEYWKWHNTGGAAPGSRHSFGIDIIVVADGRLGADNNDLKRCERAEPVLTGIALRALVRINDNPEPFPPAVMEEIGRTFRYHAQFSQL